MKFLVYLDDPRSYLGAAESEVEADDPCEAARLSVDCFNEVADGLDKWITLADVTMVKRKDRRG